MANAVLRVGLPHGKSGTAALPWLTRAAPLIVAVLAVGLALPRTVRAADDTADAFPLVQGSVWVYEGPVTWPVSPERAAETVAQRMTWEMSVREMIERGQVTAALLHGHPADLFVPDPLAAPPSDWLIIRVGTDTYYEVRGDAERVATVLARLRNSDDVLVGLVTDGELMLSLPLAPGKRFCEAEHMTRQDDGYCWVVASARPQLGGVALDGPFQAPIEYRLRKSALSGDVTVSFTPGIGITGYTAAHRAVPWSVDLRLTEYRPGAP
jgi:hypothetical protein